MIAGWKPMTNYCGSESRMETSNCVKDDEALARKEAMDAAG